MTSHIVVAICRYGSLASTSTARPVGFWIPRWRSFEQGGALFRAIVCEHANNHNCYAKHTLGIQHLPMPQSFRRATFQILFFIFILQSSPEGLKYCVYLSFRSMMGGATIINKELLSSKRTAFLILT